MLSNIVNILFPRKCIFCKQISKFNSTIDICSKCFSKIYFINKTFYKNDSRFDYNAYFKKVICVMKYKDIVKECILQYKFYGKAWYYKTFSELLLQNIKNDPECNEVDIIMSVPLDKIRKHDRGYNQAFLISKYLSKSLKLKEMSKAIERVKNIKSQSLLNKRDREKNIKGAFRINNQYDIKGKTILIIDDILTTGFTLNECSKVLKNSGAKEVICAVLASGKIDIM